MSSGEQQADGGLPFKEQEEAETSSLLDNVLDLTEQAERLETDDGLLQLAAVAQDFDEHVLSLEGLTGLVTEALREYAKDARLSDETWKSLSVKVANVLFEDPSARERLDRFWMRLLEVRR
jgi:hypothetical protein